MKRGFWPLAELASKLMLEGSNEQRRLIEAGARAGGLCLQAYCAHAARFGGDFVRPMVLKWRRLHWPSALDALPEIADLAKAGDSDARGLVQTLRDSVEPIPLLTDYLRRHRAHSPFWRFCSLLHGPDSENAEFNCLLREGAFGDLPAAEMMRGQLDLGEGRKSTGMTRIRRALSAAPSLADFTVFSLMANDLSDHLVNARGAALCLPLSCLALAKETNERALAYRLHRRSGREKICCNAVRFGGALGSIRDEKTAKRIVRSVALGFSRQLCEAVEVLVSSPLSWRVSCLQRCCFFVLGQSLKAFRAPIVNVGRGQSLT
jgi:hypothetical protein